MDSGLSARIARVLQEHAPKTAAHDPPKNYNATTAIDLSKGQNEVLGSELLEFLKTTVEENLTTEAFATPPANGGSTVLREALSSFFNRYFDPVHPVSSDQVVVTAGASEAFESLVHSICDEGDSVIVPGPYWHGFDQICSARAGVNIIAAHPPTYQNYDSYLLPSLQAAYDFAPDRSKIKAVVLCNPQNPLSRCHPKESLVECMEFCQERGLHLISDEILALTSLNTFSEDAPPFTSALSLTEPLMRGGAIKVNPAFVHVVWSASKLFGSSGLRVGCLISQQNPDICSAVALLTASHTNNIASLYLSSLLNWSQLPTLLALNSERLTASYKLLAAALQQWNIPFVRPTHGIFVFARLGKKVSCAVEEKAFYNRLAVQGVRIGHGRFFSGVELEFGWARIRFSVPLDTMRTALTRISRFLEKEAQ